MMKYAPFIDKCHPFVKMHKKKH